MILISSLLIISVLQIYGSTPCEVAAFTTHYSKLHHKNSIISLSSSVDAQYLSDPATVNVAIAGAGPSGLLLAHKLLSSQNQSNRKYKITMFEGRSDPRLLSKNALDDRAYALGIGVRGRTAIQSVSTALWEQVKTRGFLSDKFQMYFNPTTKITLRDDKKDNQSNREGGKAPLEPSLLIYQTDLCSALLDELEKYVTKGDLKLLFNSKITNVDLMSPSLTIQQDLQSTITTIGSFDLICGCDGVNSKVRESMEQASQGVIQVIRKGLPGIYKVARMDHMPSTLEANAVALIMPSSAPSSDNKKTAPSSTTLFVEPVINGGACVLFAGRDSSDPLLGPSTQNVTDTSTLVQDVLQRYPLLNTTCTTVDIPSVVTQLLSQNPSSASSIWCNTYSFLDKAVLCGDAAHCTGGVSGQGVNSALVDSMVLAECLQKHVSSDKDKKNAIRLALQEYSWKQVPEGHALYEMSVGALPRFETTAPVSNKLDEILLGIKRIVRVVNTGLDTIFGGRFGIGQQPIQTRFTTSLESFGSIRRSRELYFDDPFKSDEDYQKDLQMISNSIDVKCSSV